MAAALLACLTILPLALRAQSGTGTITGRVLNQGTGDYLRNAIVSIPGTDISANAEAGGVYTLRNVPAGTTKIAVSYTGLDPFEATVNVPADGSVTYDVTLTSKEYNSDVIKLGEFVVASDREGNAKAIMEQKNSIEAKQVLASDTFGSISEGNVGEFLKYLPGITIDYTEADARSVSMSGLDPKYTAITMDGNPIASSGIAAASGVGGNRAFEFEQISISSIETVEVFRTPQPENPGSALAGGVNLRSRGAFDSSGRRITLNAGLASNSMSGSPLKKHPGWDDEEHYRVQPNWRVDYADTFFGKKLGVLAGYNYSYTFSEQKAETVFYAYDTDLTNNATEIPRVTSFSYRDSPKPTIRYNVNGRIDYKFSKDLWVSARAEYNRYHAKFFSRDLNFNFTTTANSPDPDGTGAGVAGPVVPGVEYSLNSQTATVGTVGINQGGGGTNKYGATANYGLNAYYKRGAFRADLAAGFSRSQTWYKDNQFGFFWSVNPNALGGLGFRFNRNGSADPAVYITQTSGPDYRNLANHPNGFSVTRVDRQGEDQRYNLRADMQYDTRLAGIPFVLKFGAHINEVVNNSDRKINGRTQTRLGADGVAASADDNLARWAEPTYRMQFDYGGNVDGMPNLDRWALYKDFQANPGHYTSFTDGNRLEDQIRQARDAKEQIDAGYFSANFKLFKKLSIQPGVRYERTRGSAAGPSDLGDRETRRRLGLPFLVVPPATALPALPAGFTTADIPYIATRYGGGRTFAKQNYDTWLRYLHMAYRPISDLTIKASYNQSISRPDMNWLIGGLVITDDNPADANPNRASAGNSDLKPELSRTLNITAEYYSQNVGLISVSGYRRDFKDFIRELDLSLPAGGSFNDEPLPTGVSPTDPWIIRTRDNVVKAHLSSVEFAVNRTLDFLPGPLNRLAMRANYTYVDFSNYELFLRAQNFANLSWSFPYKINGRDLTIRWSSNWREGYRNEINVPLAFQGGVLTVNPSADAARGYARHVRESFTHTLDVSWEFRRNTFFYLTARNIFNQDQGEYRGRSDLRTRWVQTGAVWTSGLTYRF